MSYTVDGKDLLSAKDAAKQFGYTPDYVSRLAREEKILGKKFGRAWFVEEESLKSFIAHAEKEKALRQQELQRERLNDYHFNGVATGTSVAPAATSPQKGLQKSSTPTPVPSEYTQHFAVALLRTTGAGLGVFVFLLTFLLGYNYVRMDVGSSIVRAVQEPVRAVFEHKPLPNEVPMPGLASYDLQTAGAHALSARSALESFLTSEFKASTGARVSAVEGQPTYNLESVLTTPFVLGEGLLTFSEILFFDFQNVVRNAPLYGTYALQSAFLFPQNVYAFHQDVSDLISDIWIDRSLVYGELLERSADTGRSIGSVHVSVGSNVLAVIDAHLELYDYVVTRALPDLVVGVGANVVSSVDGLTDASTKTTTEAYNRGNSIFGWVGNALGALFGGDNEPSVVVTQPEEREEQPEPPTQPERVTTVVERVPTTVIQNVTEQISVSGIPRDELTVLLQQLENELRSEIALYSARAEGGIVGNYRAIQLTNAINSLNGVTITNPTIIGGSISGTSGIDSGATTLNGLTDVSAASPSFGNLVYFDGTEWVTIATSSLGISGTALWSVSGSDVYFNTGNVGIGTTSPYAPLSVVGEIVSAFFTATTTATSTFAGGIELAAINQTGSATSTFANGIELSGGCFSVNGTCVGSGGSSFGQAFELATNAFSQSALAPTTTQNLLISGTGTSTFAGGLEAWRQIAAPYFQATSTATSSLPQLDVTGVQVAGDLDVDGTISFNGVTGSTWSAFCTAITGSADLCDGNDATGGASFGQAFELTNNYLTPTTTVGVIVNASSTITALSVETGTTTNATSTNLFATNLRVDTLTGPLQATNGVVSASSSISTNFIENTSGTNTGDVTLAGALDYITIVGQTITRNAISLVDDITGILAVTNGGTGWGEIQANTLLLGNGTSQLATTTAGTNGQVLALVSGVPSWVATTTLSTISGTLAANQGGTGQDTSGFTGILGINAGTYYQSATTTFSGGLTYSGGNVTADLGTDIDLTSEVTGVLPDANVANDITLTNITQITNRAISDTTGTLSVARGGTGTTTAPLSQLIYGGTGGVYQSVSTTSVTCAGSVSCSTFDVIGSTPITLTGSGGGFGQAFEVGTNVFSQSALAPTTTQNLAIDGVGTSTFAGGIEAWRQIAAPYFQATSTTATSTLPQLDVTGVQVSNSLDIDGNLSFDSITGTSWSDFCTSITGSADLCDGNDAGSGAGSGTISTTTPLVDTYITYATGADTVGAEAAFTYDDATDRLTVVNASTTNISATYASSTSGFFGSLSIGALTGPLQATNGVVSASSSISANFIENLSGTNTGDVTLSGALDYITLVGQNIVRGAIDLATDITGILAVGNGGTGWGNIQANTLLLGNGTGQLATTSAGTNGQVLSLQSGVPSWVATTTFSGGLTYSGGNVTADLGTDIDLTSEVTGTLPVANGGTGTTTAPISQLLYGGTGGVYQSVPTTTATIGSGLSYSGTFGALVGGVAGTLSLDASGDWTGTIDGNNFADGAVETGDLLYGSAGGTISEINPSTNGFVLALENGLPTWVATSSIQNGVASLQQTFGSAQTGALTIGTSTQSFNGLTLGNTLTNSGTTFTLTPSVSGTLDNSGLTNSSVSYGGVSVSLGGADATPAFDLSDATGLPLATGVSGTLPVANGGTGSTSPAGFLFGPNDGTLQGTTTIAQNYLDDAIARDSELHDAVTLAGALDYITISGQEITRNAIDLAADVTGTLPVANGGTGATTLNNLITLGTHTTGNYLATLSGTANQITVTGSGSESATPTLSIPSLFDIQQASTTQFSSLSAYFGATATTSIDSAGNATFGGNIIIGGDTINEFAGTGLTVSGNALTADLGTDIAAGEIADGDHGDFTYSSGSATLDTNVVSDNEIDYSTVTLSDFTDDVGFLTNALRNWTFNGSYLTPTTTVGVIVNASSTITALSVETGTTTNATSTNLFATNLRVDTLTGPLQATNGVVSASSSISTNFIENTSGTNTGDVTLAGALDYITIVGQTITRNAISLVDDITGILAVTNGGTGWGEIQANTLLLGNGTSQLATTTAGTNGQVLALVSGVPSWVATTTLSTISGTLAANQGGTGQDTSGFTGILGINAGTYYQSATTTFSGGLTYSGGNVTADLGTDIDLTSEVTGTLPVANGGTGATTFTNNRLLTGNSTSAIVDEANLTFDGSLLTVTGNASTTQLTTTGAAYLATTGGNVGVGTTTPGANLTIVGTTGQNLFQIATSTDQSIVVVNENGRLSLSNQLRLAGGLTNASGEIVITAGSGRDSFADNAATHIYNSDVNTGSYPFDQIGNLILEARGDASGRGIALVTGTTPAVRFMIDDSGDIGIGTTSPGSLLSLGNTGNDTINISTTATSTFGSGIDIRTGCFAINGTCVSGGGGSGTVNTGDAGYFAYYPSSGTTVDDQTALYTDGTNVGVGTSSPWARLAVNPAAGDTNQFVVGSSTATSFLIDNQGFVGIGTSSPQAPLHIEQTNNVKLLLTDTDGSIDWGLVTGNTDIFSIQDRTNSTIPLRIEANAPSDSVYITGTGVGVSTSSPWAKFAVNPVAGDTNQFVVGSSTATSFLIDSGGQIGIATTSPEREFVLSGDSGGTFLEINAPSGQNSRLVFGADGGDIWNIGSIGADSRLTFFDAANGNTPFTIEAGAATDSLRVDSTNNIGLGSSTPGTLLSLGDTGNDTINISATATSTFGSGIDIRTGCFGIGGVCLSFSTLSGALDLATQVGSSILAVTNGGTGWGEIQANTLLLGNGTSQLATTTAGTNGQVLALVSGVPSWVATTTLSTISGTLAANQGGTGQDTSGFTGILGINAGTYYQSATTTFSGGLTYSGGNVTADLGTDIDLTSEVTGTLPVANGGTGATTFTNNRLLTGNSTSAIVDEANLTFDGSLLTVTGNASTTQLTTTGAAYLATTGGNVGVGTTSPWARFAVNPVAGDTNQFVVGSSTATSFLIDNQGFVGIGTTTPEHELSVSGDSGASFLQLNAPSGNNSRILFANDGSSRWNLGSVGADDRFTLVDNVNSNTVFTVQNGVGSSALYVATGGVGLGTSSPWARLAVNPVAGDTNQLVVGSSTRTSFVIDSAGQVGIGTTTLDRELTISSDSGATLLEINAPDGENQRIVFNEGGDDIWNIGSLGADNRFTFVDSSTGQSPLIIEQSASGNSLYIDSTNNVGLGSSTPGTSLSIGDTGNDTINISATATSTFGSGINIRGGCFAVDGVCVTGGGSSVSFGSDNQVPFTNSGGTDFDYSSNFTFDGSKLTALNASTTRLSITGGYLDFTASAATTTVINNNPYAWTIATSTDAAPLFRIDTTTNNETVTLGSPYGSDVYIGDVGSASNLVFEESSTIHGQGGNTLTFGQSGDIINFAVDLGVGTTSPFATLAVNPVAGATNLLAIGSSNRKRNYFSQQEVKLCHWYHKLSIVFLTTDGPEAVQVELNSSKRIRRIKSITEQLVEELGIVAQLVAQF